MGVARMWGLSRVDKVRLERVSSATSVGDVQTKNITLNRSP